MRAAALLALAITLAGGAGHAQPQQASSASAPTLPELPALPISVAVARQNGKPVVEAAWVAAQVQTADRLFSVCGVRLALRPLRSLDARHAALETRADRDGLAAQLVADAINVFVVASLRDVDDRSLYRLGVHWRPRRRPGARLIIVTPEALPTTLAHELGHFFGNRHTVARGNLMSYRRQGAAATLTAAQGRRVRAEARAVLSSLKRHAVTTRPAVR